ncbi:MAG TPA: type II secretion system F family protein, partial [Chroococcales cyanobacterium]
EDEFLLADAQRRRGFYTKARALLDRVARIRTKLFGEYHDETLAAQMRMIWITLQQKKEAELVKQIEQTRQGFEKKHRSCGFCEFLDIASLLRPYIADKARAEVTAICQMILSAIRTVYGIGHDEARWMSAECKTLIAALGAEEGPEPGEAEGVQENLSSAGSGARVAGAGAGAHLSASPASSGDAPKPGERFEVSEEEEPIYSASKESFAPPGLLQLALNLGGIDLESSVFLYLWLGAGTLFGALAVGTYVLSGNFFLILEPFTSAFLCITLLVWFSVSLMIVIRQDQLSRQLPDALDILASTMNAGNSMIASMDHLSQTLSPPLKLEFQRAMKSVRSGKSIYYAISELKSHVNVVQLEHLANSIRTSKSSGTGLVKQLTTLARELREKEKERLLMRRHLNTALQIGGFILISTVCFLLSVSFNPAFGAAVLGSMSVRLLLFCILGILAAGIIYAKNPPQNFSAGSAAIVADAKQIASEYDKAGRLRAELSTFLDLVVMHVQAGAPAPAALKKVCNEARSSCPTLCGELSVLLENATSFKMAVPNALRTVGQRYGVEELLVLSSTLEASARLGGSISYQLIEQSEALRHRLAKAKQGRAASVSTVAIVIVVAIMMIWEMIAALLRGH